MPVCEGCAHGFSFLQSLAVTPPRSSTRSNTNRERMLRRLRRSYRELLTQSLQGIAWMELGLTERPDAVQNTTNLTLRIAPQEEQLLPPGVSIIQVYGKAEEELLILGEPGAGKSTLLLYLAQHLVVQAEADERCLLPVLLPLSSWAVKQAGLEDWMIEQIAVTYDIPRKVSQLWVQQEQILPLLDGLDEMQEAARPACIAAINAYHREHLTPLVVCSRTAEYESAASSQRLVLQSSVVVRPLTSEQREEALSGAGESVAKLRTAIHEQPALRELATTPLMLSVLMLAYQGTTVPTGSLKETDLEQQIWTDYLKRMLERKRQGHIKPYELLQTRSWLGWLAQQMRVHNQTFFYAERLQADWLPKRLLRSYAWIAERTPALVIGVLTSLLISFFLGSYNFRLSVGSVGAFLGGWLNQIQEQSAVSPIGPLPRKRCSLRSLVVSLGSCLILGALVGASFIFSVNGVSYPPLYWLHGSLICGISIGLGGWIMLTWLSRLSQAVGSSLTRPPHHRFSRTRWLGSIHLRRAVVTTLVLGVAFGLSDGLIAGQSGGGGLLSGLNGGLTAGLSGGLGHGQSFGVTGFLLSFMLEKREGRLRLAERLHWNGWSLLRPKHLRNSLLLAGLFLLSTMLIIGLVWGLIDGLSDGLISGLVYGVKVGSRFGLSSGLSSGLSFGLSYWLLFGLSQGVIQEQVEDQDRRTFNQGIRRSLRNGFFASLLGGGIIMGTGILNQVLLAEVFSGPNFDLGNRLSIGLNFGLHYGWFLALSGGLLVWVTIGGLTVLRHYIIRFLLALSQTFPWRARAFLDSATAHILLKRVGGGYSFVHRRLLDYCADAYPSTVKERDKPLPVRDRGTDL